MTTGEDQPALTFADLVAAMQSRLGRHVVVHVARRGNLHRTEHGVLSPGELDASDASPDDNGRIVFRLAPYASWFTIDPRLVTRAYEEPGHRRLRVEMPDRTLVIETTDSPRA